METVSKQLPLAFNRVVEQVGSKDLPISWNKAGFLASSSELARSLCEQWPMELASRSQFHRDLGGDATDGRHRRVSTHLDRFLAARSRALRLRLLQKGGAKVYQVHRAGPTAVALWGSCVHGVADTRLHQLR
eukprot:7275029-Pyramimonas_sp.AAC.1